jgi:hypothetical protein
LKTEKAAAKVGIFWCFLGQAGTPVHLAYTLKLAFDGHSQKVSTLSLMDQVGINEIGRSRISVFIFVLDPVAF